MTSLHNLIEPAALVQQFEEHPPVGFSPIPLAGGTPAFSTAFDLLTTLHPSVRRRIDAIPWLASARVLRPLTLFVGTTVSEYVPLPAATTAEKLVDEVTLSGAPYAFIIVKDLPEEGLLVGDDAFAFSREVEESCRQRGFFSIAGQALAYVPIDFASVEELLAGMSHARRKNIRRKLRSRASLNIEEVPIGADVFHDSGFVSELYELYRNVYAQAEVHFDLLTREFFAAVLVDKSIAGHVVLYRTAKGLIGFNLCVFGSRMYIDKYVGFRYPQAHEHDLYTVSWFYNLERALALGCRYYVAGWTDPEIKRRLGARFTWTRHAVFARNAVVRSAGRILRHLFESDARWHKRS